MRRLWALLWPVVFYSVFGVMNEQRGQSDHGLCWLCANPGCSYYGGGCFYDTTYISEGQVFLNEIFGSWTLLFLAFGLGLDPRQALLYGPRLGPMLVGLSLGLLTFATSGAVPGYAGAQMHPGRCFAFGVAKRDMSGMICFAAQTCGARLQRADGPVLTM